MNLFERGSTGTGISSMVCLLAGRLSILKTAAYRKTTVQATYSEAGSSVIANSMIFGNLRRGTNDMYNMTTKAATSSLRCKINC